MKKKNVKLLSIDDSIYEYYIHKIKGNKDDSYDMARLKLSRNWYLARFVKKEDGVEVRDYGNLRIYRTKDTIVKIQNHKGKELHPEWHVSYKDKKYIEKLLKKSAMEECTVTLESKSVKISLLEKILNKLRG